jgi:succinate-semialdehyde dehydrogenase/glutarate-semialdehyde dehydrogenase
VIHQPVGVALLVTPWNFPAAMAARKIGPALAAGCTTILKPASETPLTALALAALMEEAGLPAGVVNVLPSRQSGKVVSAMLADPRVRKLSFTGSTEVGRTAEASQRAHRTVPWSWGTLHSWFRADLTRHEGAMIARCATAAAVPPTAST